MDMVGWGSLEVGCSIEPKDDAHIRQCAICDYYYRLARQKPTRYEKRMKKLMYSMKCLDEFDVGIVVNSCKDKHLNTMFMVATCMTNAVLDRMYLLSDKYTCLRYFQSLSLSLSLALSLSRSLSLSLCLCRCLSVSLSLFRGCVFVVCAQI
jgi:hypothetical protein